MNRKIKLEKINQKSISYIFTKYKQVLDYIYEIKRFASNSNVYKN